MHLYLNVNINVQDKTYYLTLSEKKPQKHNYAADTLEKIETILANNFEYAKARNDPFNKAPPEHLKKLLKSQAKEIRAGYLAKVEDTNPLIRAMYNQTRKVNTLAVKIGRHAEAARKGGILPRGEDALQVLLSHMDDKTRAAVARTNRDGLMQVGKANVVRAQKLGFKGTDEAGARLFLKALSEEMSDCFKLKLIPKQYAAYNGKTLDIDATLKKLETMDPKKYFKLFTNMDLYFEKYTGRPGGRFRLTKKRELNRFFPLLIKAADVSFSRVIRFELATILNLKDVKFDCTPLFYACFDRNVELCKLLLKYGAKTEVEGGNAYSALQPIHEAARLASPKVLQLLLKDGAKPSVRDHYNNNALHYAAHAVIAKDAIETINLLLNSGVSPHSVNRWGKTPLQASLHPSPEVIARLQEAMRERNP